MDVFGGRWSDHPERIAHAWRSMVEQGDLVLVPGDLSWAMKLEQAADDLRYLGDLPGGKVIIRGNHDYWWQAIGKVRKALPQSVQAIQNDFVHVAGDWAICGTRGWTIPQHPDFAMEDEKLLEREISRLELSLKAASRAGLAPLVTMIHYPPAPQNGESTGFTDLLESYGVRLCVYGHLHGDAGRRGIDGVHRGVRYKLTACDAIGFKPMYIGRTDEQCSLIIADDDERVQKRYP